MGQKNYGGDIAIIGTGCELPSGLNTPDALWQFLENQGDAVVEVPKTRWSLAHFYDPVEQTPGKTTMRWGYFVDPNSYHFEPLFFGISPREGMGLDFQQRLLLGVTWRALEDASLTSADWDGSRTGVFIGGFTLDHLLLCGNSFMRTQIRDQFAAVSASMTMLAARLAHVYGLKGPTMTMDTACSSSLVAIHQACNSLRLNECDMAIAGGVNFMMYPQIAISMTKGHFLAKDGRSKTFDASVDGYGRGEGCVILALKRLEDALRDGDDVRGVIVGSGVNQDGRTPVLTMPDADAQETLIREVADRAGVQPGQIAYVEAHGTGTPVGDPIEAKAIAKSIGQYRPEGENVVVGAVKANLGHTEAAAGALGVLKATLCLQHRRVPPQVNLKELNPEIPFEEYRLSIPQHKAVDLPSTGPLYAAVNAFGYGGTNAVALLRAPTEAEKQSARKQAVKKNRLKGVRPVGFLKRQPLMLSAFSEASLRVMAENYANKLADDPGLDWEALCFSAVRYRSRFRHRAVILPQHKETCLEEGEAALRALAAGEEHSALFTGEAISDRSVGPAFVFSGMGPQWWGMGRYMLRKAPSVVKKLAQRCDELFQKEAGWSIVAELLKPEASSRVQETIVAQPAIFLVQICLAEFFAHHGIRPSAIVGHSVGEVAAAYVSGALSLENATKVIFHRSRLQARLEGRGGMLAVGLSEDALQETLRHGCEGVSIAAINGPNSCTLAGDRSVLEHLATTWEKEDVFVRFLKVDVPYHSPQMAEIEEDMHRSLSELETRDPTVPLYSTVTGARWTSEEKHDGAYWYRNARQPVRFSAAIRKMLEDNQLVFLELAAHPVLGSSILETAAETHHTVEVCPTLRRRQDEASGLTRALVRLALRGADIDWRYILRPGRLDLPTYIWRVADDPWEETEASRRDRLDLTVHPILGTPSLLSQNPSWRADMTKVLMPWLPDHRIDGVTLFPAAGYIEAALAAHHQLETKEPAILEELRIDAPLILQDGKAPMVTWSFDPSSRVLSFASETLAWNGDWQEHGHVTVLQAAPWGGPSVDVADFYHGTTCFDGETVYQELARNGLEYGPSFRTLKELYRGKGFAVGKIALNADEAHTVADYHLHPALLDGAMHAVIGAFPLEGQSGVFVPTAIRRLSYQGIKTDRVLVRVRPTAQTDDTVEADLHLYTDDGLPVAEILGLQCRRLARAGQDEASRVGRFLYAPSWVSGERQLLLSEPLKVALLGDGQGLASRLSTFLEERGIDVVVHRDWQSEGACGLLRDEEALRELRSLVVLPSIVQGATAAQDLVQAAMGLMKNLPTQMPKCHVPVVVVTRDGQYVDGQEGTVEPAQRALSGFFRGIQGELLDLTIRCVDIPTVVPEDMMEDLAAEVVLDDAAEDSVVLRPEQRLVQRVVVPSLNPEPEPVPLETLQQRHGGGLGVRLVPGTSGVLEGLSWQSYDATAKPGPGQVLLETRAVSLNFKDLLKTTPALLPASVIDGTYSGHQLGMEAVAEVTAVGEGVTNVQVGEHVVPIYPDSFATHRIVDSDIAMTPLRGDLLKCDFALLAGSPVVFATAYYCLEKLANLQKGETVLIHAGAGGVGQAAIQFARYKGAIIYTTAGSPEKRELLWKQGCHGVWDSRTLEFVDGIREATNGRGVDVVLNSLPGEGMVHSLRLTAHRGRFIEIGKRDIAEQHRLNLAPFNENIAFFSFDLDRLMPDPRLNSMFDEVFRLFQQGHLDFVNTHIFAAKDVVDAFRLLGSSKHVGKIVLSYDDIAGVKARPPKKEEPHVRSDGTYLVTGGFGGLGLKTAEALVQQGAGEVHLAGRSLPSQPETQEALDRLMRVGEAAECKVVAHKVDVSDVRAVSDLVAALAAGEKPLRGIFHAAGVLDDARLETMTTENVTRVLAPKVQGAYALDEASHGMKLDYFVLYSSVMTMLGNVGQSAYVAANSYLEALAEKRRQRGENALAIGWGAIGDVGMLKRYEDAGRMLAVSGLNPIEAHQALEMIPSVLKTDRPSVSFVDVDWSKAFGAFHWLENVSRFITVRKNMSKDGLSDTLRDLLALPDMERLGYVLKRLKEQLGVVLRIDPERISDNARLSELGIDSLAAVELQVAIREEFGVDVSLVLLARNETIIEMSRSLLRQAIQTRTEKAPVLTTEQSSKEG